jgi:transposase
VSLRRAIAVLENDRRVLNGILWVLRSGAPWRDLPENFGPYTCHRERPFCCPTENKNVLTLAEECAIWKETAHVRVRSQIGYAVVRINRLVADIALKRLMTDLA